jgi:hypothetical protein
MGFGLALLLKSSFALQFGVTAVVIALQRRRQARLASLSAAIALGLGAAVSMAPLMWRNVIVGAPLVSVSSLGAQAIISGNAGDSVQLPDGYLGSRHLPDIMHKTDGALLGVAVETLRTNDTAIGYLRGLAGRFLAVWRPAESPNNVNLYYYARHAPVLAWLPVTFLPVGVLGCIGILLSLRQASRSWPLLLLVATSLVPLVAFHAISRYRIPLLVGLLPYAGATLAWATRRAANFLGTRLAVASGGAVVAALLWLLAPRLESPPKIRAVDYIAPYEYYYEPRARASIAEGDLARAAEEFGRSFEVLPAIARINEIVPRSMTLRERDLGLFYAEQMRRYARILEQAGRSREAEHALARSQLLSWRVRSVQPKKGRVR